MSKRIPWKTERCYPRCGTLPLLALWAEMRRSLRHHHSADRRSALQARLAGPLIHAVLELEEALAALCIHVIRNRRTARRGRLRPNLDDGVVEFARAIRPD